MRLRFAPLLIALAVTGCDADPVAPTDPVPSCGASTTRTFHTEPVRISARVVGIDSVDVDFGDGTRERHPARNGRVDVDHVFQQSGALSVHVAAAGAAQGGCRVAVTVFSAASLTAIEVLAFPPTRTGGTGWDGIGSSDADVFFYLIRSAALVLRSDEDPRVRIPTGGIWLNVGADDLPLRWDLRDVTLDQLDASYTLELRDDDADEGSLSELIGRTQAHRLEVLMRELPPSVEIGSANGHVRARLHLEWN